MPEDPIKDVLQMLPYGFYSVTSQSGDEVNIMVANWITQASFEPRMLAFALQKTSYSHGLIVKGKVFAVNLFSEQNADAIRPFTKSRAKNPDKVKDARYTPGPVTGCPVLEGAAAYLEVRVKDVLDIGGDHDIVVGEVVGAGVVESLEPAHVLTLPDLGWCYAG